MKVKNLLKDKGQEIWSVAPTATVYKALELMRTKNIGALLVMDAAKLVGIISERDYARKVILEGKYSRDIPVSEVMTRDVIYVDQDQSVQECLSLMTYKFLRHLPVMKGGVVIGIISIGDIVKAVVDEQGGEIEHLVRYIAGIE